MLEQKTKDFARAFLLSNTKTLFRIALKKRWRKRCLKCKFEASLKQIYRFEQICNYSGMKKATPIFYQKKVFSPKIQNQDQGGPNSFPISRALEKSWK